MNLQDNYHPLKLKKMGCEYFMAFGKPPVPDKYSRPLYKMIEEAKSEKFFRRELYNIFNKIVNELEKRWNVSSLKEKLSKLEKTLYDEKRPSNVC